MVIKVTTGRTSMKIRRGADFQVFSSRLVEEEVDAIVIVRVVCGAGGGEGMRCRGNGS